MKIRLSDIFIIDSDKVQYSVNDLSQLDLNTNFINEMSKRLGLNYLEKSINDDNLCFVNHDDLDWRYKQYYSKNDVISYLISVLNSESFDTRSVEIPFPETTLFIDK